jgi:hypothetical protein
MIEAIDIWSKEQARPISRSEAMRCLIDFALYAGPVIESWSKNAKYDPRLREEAEFLTSKYKALRDSYRLK